MHVGHGVEAPSCEVRRRGKGSCDRAVQRERCATSTCVRTHPAPTAALGPPHGTHCPVPRTTALHNHRIRLLVQQQHACSPLTADYHRVAVQSAA